MTRSPRRLAIRALAVAVLLVAAVPAYLALEQAWRPVALRIACGIAAIAGCSGMLRAVRRSAAGVPPSALDARPPATPQPALDGRFLRLRDDIVFSARSRRYFDAALWPRLVRLAGADLLRPPPRRGWRRLGPSLGTIERLLAAIERRP